MKAIDFDYYEWLISQIHIPNGKSYASLFEVMHNIEFHWTVPNDDNRLQDGLDLRYEFTDGKQKNLNLLGATVLEVLIALSRRVAFLTSQPAPKWAWKLLKHLRLTQMSDPLTEEQYAKINDILDALIWRTYQSNGQGGFFPLQRAIEDQTKIEIWMQMNAYVIERNLF